MVECPFCGEWTDRPHIRLTDYYGGCGDPSHCVQGERCFTQDELDAEGEPKPAVGRLDGIPMAGTQASWDWMNKVLGSIIGLDEL